MSNILLFFMSSYTPTVENGAYNRAQTNEAVLYDLQKKMNDHDGNHDRSDKQG